MSAQPIPIDQAPERALEQKALTLPEQVKGIAITNQPTYELAAAKLLDVAAMRREITEYHKPLKQKAHEAHKAICDAEARMLAPVAQAEQILKRGIAAYETEQRHKAEEERRRLEEEERRRREEEIEAAAQQAEAEGASVEEVQAIIEQPVVVPAVRPEPTFTPVAGVSTRGVWKAEVVSIRELCRAVAEGRASAELVAPNMTALNGLARAMKQTFNIPGCRVVRDTAVAAGRR